MNDLIKREDAIKALTEVLYEEPPYLNSMEKCMAFAEKELSRIPTAEPKIDKDALIRLIQGAVYDGDDCKRLMEMVEPKQEWTPCSERLPEDNDVYLVTAELEYDNGRICKSDELAEYEPDPFLVTGGKWYIDGLPCGNNRTVIAWRPLPKPWEGADNEL